MPDLAEGLTFILPVFDGEKSLGKAVTVWLPVLDSLKMPYDFVIVNDGSLDGTQSQAEQLAAKNKSITVVSHPDRKGFGACIRTGLEQSRRKTVFYASVDHGWNPADLPRLLKSLDVNDEYMNKAVEVVNGRRRGTVMPTGKKWRNRLHRYFMRVVYGFWPDPPGGYLGKSEERFRFRCRWMFGLRLADPNSKFKVFRRSVLDRIEIQSDGDFVNAELLAKANFIGSMMDEVGLSDREVPPPAPDVRTEMWKVFNNAKFRPPVFPPPAYLPPEAIPGNVTPTA